MKVKDVIKELQKCNPNAEFIVSVCEPSLFEHSASIVETTASTVYGGRQLLLDPDGDVEVVYFQ